jgi:hypothetical protein
MQASANQRTPITMWKIVVLGICICVFLFGLQAKLAQYQAPSPTVTPVTSAKLWQGESLLEAQNFLGAVGLLIFAVLLRVHTLYIRTSVPLPVWATPAPVRLSTLSHLRRFFRPPPAR